MRPWETRGQPLFFHPHQPPEARFGATPKTPQNETTLNNGYLGSRIDEERSEMRYVM